jgi:dTDP-4-amino-4,6-dideoxygalactose transaminase
MNFFVVFRIFSPLLIALFHYVPLHASPMGRRVGRSVGSMAVTEDLSERLLRLPLWIGEGVVKEVVKAVRGVLS